MNTKEQNEVIDMLYGLISRCQDFPEDACRIKFLLEEMLQKIESNEVWCQNLLGNVIEDLKDD